MYAVILTGGKQYRVQPGDFIEIEKLEGDVGSPMKFEEVLFASKGTAENPQIWLGKPFLGGAVVEAQIVAQGRGEKITIVKMKRRKQYRRTQGHRQDLTQLLVTSVSNGSGESLALSAAEKTEKVSKFYTNLKPKGPARTEKLLSSKKKRDAVAKSAAAAA